MSLHVGRSGNIAILLGAFLPIFIERVGRRRREGGGRAADAEQGRKRDEEDALHS